MNYSRLSKSRIFLALSAVSVLLLQVPGQGFPTVVQAKTPLLSNKLIKLDPAAQRPSLQRSFKDYTVKIYQKDDLEGYFVILKGGKQVYKEEGGKFEIGGSSEVKGQKLLTAMGKDITGDGEPDLVVSEWTGGAHCCFVMYVFQIGATFRRVATLDAQHSDTARFVNLDKKPGLEFEMYDWTFAYWRTSFAQSPAPRVVLRYVDGDYKVAFDLMRKPAPPQSKLAQKAAEVRSSEEWTDTEEPSELWSVMLDLIYTGHSQLADRFFNEAWSPRRRDKQAFLREFREQLAGSPYYKQFREK